MNWQYLLKRRLSKTAIWITLFVIIVGAFLFIFLDESCTFHVEKLIQIQKAPSFSKPANTEDHALDSKEKEEIEGV
jgi:hypothetical protein